MAERAEARAEAGRLMAAFADGLKDERERTGIHSLAADLVATVRKLR